MKSRTFLVFILAAFILTITSCREITVTTQVHKDGSFTRTITVTGDSTEVFHKNLPYPVDGSWKMEAGRDTADAKQFVVTYTKTFRNDALLNKEIRSDTGWRKQLKREVTIHKRFAFFYSYLTFEETIKAANPFTKIPLRDRLSAEEIKWLKNEVQPVTAADSTRMKNIEDKALMVVARSMTEEMTEILEKGIRQLHDPGLSPQIAKTYQDSIFQKVSDWNLHSSKDFLTSLVRWSGRKKLLDMEKNTPDLFKPFDAKLDFFSDLVGMHSYTQTVEMPGLITETNALTLKGNQVQWKVDPLSFLLTDYTMTVESRVVNYWMFVITGIVVLVLIILLVIRAFR